MSNPVMGDLRFLMFTGKEWIDVGDGDMAYKSGPFGEVGSWMNDQANDAHIRVLPYETKDSGQREKYQTGAQRDTEDDKGRFDLLPHYPLLRLAQLYQRGSVKYDSWNWTKGIPLSRWLSSMVRHALQLSNGQEDEDHASAVVFNSFGYTYTLDKIKRGELPRELDDLPWRPSGGGE